jgi:long-chain acyl-CoA synthetase
MDLLDQPTIPHLLAWRLKVQPDAPALIVHRNGQWQHLSWRQFEGDLHRAVCLLHDHGVSMGKRVVHIAANRYEWLLTDLAIQSLGAIHVPLHATLTTAQHHQQALDADPCLLIGSFSSSLANVIDLPGIARINYDSPTDLGESWEAEVSWAGLMERSEPERGRSLLESSLGRINGDSLATILYTSGTTGESKGVMLSQNNLAVNARQAYQVMWLDPSWVRLNFLPLSHIYARTCDLYAWLVGGYQLGLARSKDTVLEDCLSLRPHCLNGVPYFYERIERKLVAAGQEKQSGALRSMLGGRVVFCSVGGAPMSLPNYHYFAEQDVPLLQGYGLTETSPVISSCSMQHNRPGSVGRPVSNLQVRIAADGEIQVKGESVMQGYWRRPQATAQVIRDGWFSTGDLGYLDEEGFLWINGRKKELIVTAGGKKIAPIMIESLLDQDPLISQSMVVGDKQNYLIALIVPDRQQIEARLAVENLKPTATENTIFKWIEKSIRTRLKEVSHYEQVQKFCLIDQPFSIENGLLTAKLTIRRDAIAARYAQQIRQLYGQDCLERLPP